MASVAIFFLISNKCWFAVCTCEICIPTIFVSKFCSRISVKICFWKLLVIKIGIQFLMTLCFEFLWNIHMQLVVTNKHDDTSPVFSCCTDSLFESITLIKIFIIFFFFPYLQLTNPEWKPPKECSLFLNDVKEKGIRY